jgi:hypothetical protein
MGRPGGRGDAGPGQGGLVQRDAPPCRRRKVRSAPFPCAAKTAPTPLHPKGTSAPTPWAWALLLPTVRGAAGPLIGLAKRETGRARSKEKGAWMRSGAVALRAEGGRRIGACSDLALPSGTLGPSAIPSTAVPWRMVRKLPGCKDAFELLLFSCLALRRSGDFRH